MSYFCGLDIGSTYTKIVITSDTEICRQEVFRTATDFNEKIEHVINHFCSTIGIPEKRIKRIGVTGYGRNNYSKADFKNTEIKAVAKCVNKIDPDATMVLDIGGQDYKIVYLDINGLVSDFYVSDKCASGSGRFIELLAMRLGLTMDELSEIDLTDAENIGLSSTCAVFADAEVIKLITHGKRLSDIVYSIYLTIIRRVLSSFRQKNSRIVLTGGVSKNKSFVLVLKKLLPELFVYNISDVASAYGIALLAYENEVKSKVRAD